MDGFSWRELTTVEGRSILLASTTFIVFGWQAVMHIFLFTATSFKESFCVGHFGGEEDCLTHGGPQVYKIFLTMWLLVGALANMLGAVFGSWLQEYRGRRGTAVAGSIVNVAGLMLLVFSANPALAMFAVMIMGCGEGLVVTSIPIYVSEIASCDLRGKFGYILSLAGVLGATCLTCLAMVLHDMHANWRWQVGTQIVIGVLSTYACAVLTESPRWLCSYASGFAAESALRALRPDDDVRQELQFIRAAADVTSDTDVLWRDMWATVALRKRFVSSWLTQGFATLSGYAYIVFRGKQLFNILELNVPYQYRLFVAVLNIVSGVAGIYLADRIGRKHTFLFGCAGLLVSDALCLATTGIDISNAGHEQLLLALYACGLSVYIWVYAFAIGPLSIFYAAELFPTVYRAKGYAVGYMVKCLGFMLVTICISVSEIPPGVAYFLFFLIGGIVYFAGRTWLQETNGRTLEEMSDLDDDINFLRNKHSTEGFVRGPLGQSCFQLLNCCYDERTVDDWDVSMRVTSQNRPGVAPSDSIPGNGSTVPNGREPHRSRGRGGSTRSGTAVSQEEAALLRSGASSSSSSSSTASPRSQKPRRQSRKSRQSPAARQRPSEREHERSQGRRDARAEAEDGIDSVLFAPTESKDVEAVDV